MGLQGVEFGFLDTGEVRLHIVTAGPADGPLVVLLHGFPEFWFEWRDLIGPLAAAGYRVAAPDQRGYNFSGKPDGARAYGLDRLSSDVVAIADYFGRDSINLVGHDWGAAVAWQVATTYPRRLDRLVILNAPHPAIWRRAMTEDPVQRKKSQYVRMLRIPVLPELLIRIGGFAGLERAFNTAARPEAFTTEVLDAYRRAWKQPGALSSMINWYRALFLGDPAVPAAGSLTTPTLILWGDRDAFVEPGQAELSAALCAHAEVRHFPDASHWIVHDEPDAVRDAVLEFLKSK